MDYIDFTKKKDYKLIIQLDLERYEFGKISKACINIKIIHNEKENYFKQIIPLIDMTMQELIYKVKKEFNGEYITYDRIEITDKKQELLEWINSLAIMYQLMGGDDNDPE